MSFTFTSAFPTSRFWYSDTLLTAAAGKVIPRRPNSTWLGISFAVAQAHTNSGLSSIKSQPSTYVGQQRIVGFVQAGDFEGVVDYGIAVARPAASVGRIPVRVIEVATISPTGQHLYTVAFDLPID